MMCICCLCLSETTTGLKRHDFKDYTPTVEEKKKQLPPNMSCIL